MHDDGGAHGSDGEDKNMRRESELRRRRWKRLLEWLKTEHAMDTTRSGLRVECRASGNAGSGLFALEPCPKSSTLFTVPAKALINAKTLSSSYPHTKSGIRLSAQQLVSLHLLLHRPLGNDDSLDPTFGPFISTMPRDFESHPLTWTIHAQLNAVEDLGGALCGMLPPSVVELLRKASTRFWEDWKVVCRYVSLSPGILSRASRPDKAALEFTMDNNTMVKEYLWAWLNVNTRCIYYRLDPSASAPDNLTLCPVLDFANHAPSSTHIMPVLPSTTYPPVPGFKKRGTMLGGDYVLLASDEMHIHKDEELFLRYGGHSNRKLFTEYGFVNTWKEGECASGDFAGEVDMQDVVEALFEKSGVAGAWIKEVLEEEGYWGDWTLHSSPTPAHPSYRLVTALRLYQAVLDSTLNGRHALEDRCLDQWRKVLAGQSEIVSSANEAGWRDVLLKLCTDVAQRAREGVQLVDRLPRIAGEQPEWLQWMLGNIRLLWQEELEVGEAVAESLRSGVDF